jgi:hypothetical protein
VKPEVIPMRRLARLVSVSWLALGACVGELELTTPPSLPDTTGRGTDTASGVEPDGTCAARAEFDSAVAPLLEQKCASCHAGNGVNGAPSLLGYDGRAGYYQSVLNTPTMHGNFDPARARMLTKGAHSGSLWWDTAESDKIRTWLTAQAGCGAGDVGDNPIPDDPSAPLPASHRELLAKFAGCMSQANWQASGMASWADKAAEGGQTCGNCHGSCAFRFCTNNDPAVMLQQNRSAFGIISFMMPCRVGNQDSVCMATDKIKAMSDDVQGHPNFEAGEGDANFQSLQQFHQLTTAAMAAGTCDPPGFAAYPL